MFQSQRFRYFVFFISCIALFAFRFFYGLNNRFWDEDEKHIYLLGLELFSFRHWPHFGPDIVHTATQIPGALQSFLAGAIFFLFKAPEAPFLVVNLLSFSGLLLFAYYLSKHFPRYSLLTLFAWLTSLPWALEYSTHIYNPSYLLLPEIVFFIAIFESLPNISKNYLSYKSSFFLMGLCIAFISQLHLSWPLLVPFVALAAWFLRKSWTKLFFAGVLFTVGFAIPCLLLIPTIQTYGIHSLLQMNAENSQWNLSNLLYIFNNLVRLICYGSYESFLFIGESMRERQEFLWKFKILIPLFFFLTTLTYLQSAYFIYAMIRMYFQKQVLAKASFKLFLFALCASTLIFIASTRPPVSRNLYLLFPLSLWCSFLCIDFFVRQYRWGLKIFQAVIILGLSYHCFLSYNRFLNFPQHSLYSNRELLVKSLDEKNPYIFEKPRYSKLLN